MTKGIGEPAAITMIIAIARAPTTREVGQGDQRGSELISVSCVSWTEAWWQKPV
jgi:hypothetical protein